MANYDSLRIKQNDEWDYADALGHYELVSRMGQRLLVCEPPYVVGVCGSWGAGKTSFLKKLWAYLGGSVEFAPDDVRSIDDAGVRHAWFKDGLTHELQHGAVKLIWFNPWQHQFETSPLVALLHEIRNNFALTDTLLQTGKKGAKIAGWALLDALPKMALEFGSKIGPTLKAESQVSLRTLNREYEAENFSASLASQRFRDYFEAAIESVVGENGKLIIFIDDLDRCEGAVSYRLLEALKLYLNARNCIYVLGIDPQHLESSIARSLLEEKETWRHRALARDYLSKMFQMTFLLPTPRDARPYIQCLLDRDDGRFQSRLEKLFGFKVAEKDFQKGDWPLLIKTLDDNLPHNPRKLKSFIASWKTYLDMLPAPQAQEPSLDWRLTLVLQYLAQFEEPLYRRIEHFPGFYQDELLKFCRTGSNTHPLFYGLEIPPVNAATDLTGALSDPGIATAAAADTRQPEPRFFWISPLVTALAADTTIKMDGAFIRRHMPYAVY